MYIISLQKVYIKLFVKISPKNKNMKYLPLKFTKICWYNNLRKQKNQPKPNVVKYSDKTEADNADVKYPNTVFP